MASMTVCARFRPRSSRELTNHGDRTSIPIRASDTTFSLKDEKEEEYKFTFDRVFYETSEQVDVYEFLVLPIVQDAVNAVNGTVITYGQLGHNVHIPLGATELSVNFNEVNAVKILAFTTGAGKTYSMEGPSIQDCDDQKKGLLPRVVDGIFNVISNNEEASKYTLKLSMVEIYMEKVRDLFDLSKDNIQIKENKVQGIFLSGVTEIIIADSAEALQNLSNGIANRAVEETQMNMSSSRSHCIYIFTVQKELTTEKRTKSGKLILVDLAGSEKVEKTGAEGKILEEAKTINKSLSALGNVINALTCGTTGKSTHIPYRDSKLTRILQDSLGGNSRTALLCCCSPSCSNVSETISTLRFGARAKHVKASARVSPKEEKSTKKPETVLVGKDKDESCQRILDKLGEKLDYETVKLLEELFIVEGILFDLNSVEEMELAYEDITSCTISSLQQAAEELKSENDVLRSRLQVAEALIISFKESIACKILNMCFSIPWVGSFFQATNEFNAFRP